jgi:membrane-associated phospholipid phosphatase
VFFVESARLVFALVFLFYGVDFISRFRTTHTTILFSWEIDLPYWPQWYLIYFSSLLIPLSLLFVVESKNAVVQWANDMLAGAIISAVISFIYPTKQLPVTNWTSDPLYIFLDAISGQYGLFPSLHVALPAITLMHLFRYLGSSGRTFFLFWFVLICLSTLFVRKHFVADIAGGLAVAWVAPWLRQKLNELFWPRKKQRGA